MISKEELIEYKYPNPINFHDEEYRLRKININKLRNMLNFMTRNPEILSDFKELKTIKFNKKYGNLLGDKKIKKEMQNFFEKVDNYVNDYEINKSFLIERLKRDDLLCNNFIVDFKRQNPYEPYVLKYFKYLEKDLRFLCDLKHLPTNGLNARYVYNGIISGEEIKSQINETPASVDFVWKYEFNEKTMNFYASHKYTSGYGTAQKNQMRELENFLNHSIKSAITNNDFFIAMMDGNYYTDYYYPNFNGTPKPKIIEHIRNTKQNTKCRVATSFDFIAVVVELIKNWLNKNFKKEEIQEEIEKLEIINQSTKKTIQKV